jgi:hypothetical protein
MSFPTHLEAGYEANFSAKIISQQTRLRNQENRFPIIDKDNNIIGYKNHFVFEESHPINDGNGTDKIINVIEHPDGLGIEARFTSNYQGNDVCCIMNYKCIVEGSEGSEAFTEIDSEPTRWVLIQAPPVEFL